MKDLWIDPSDEQEEQARLAQNDVVEVVNRLINEGMDPRLVLAGVGQAACDLITCTFGATAVAPWFEGTAEMVRKLQRGDS